MTRMHLTRNQEDLVNIALTVIRNRFNDRPGNGGADTERVISTTLRNVAALIDCSSAEDVEVARRELRHRWG